MSEGIGKNLKELEGSYATIVADPPWPQKGGGPATGAEGFGDSRQSKPMPYSTMSVDNIKALQIPAAAHSHLYLWTTNGFLEEAFDVLRAWGFQFSTCLVWAKSPMGGGLGGAYGISTEFCLFGRRGKLATTARVRGTWYSWKRLYDERGKPRHSAKPPKFYAMVESVSPGPRLEMFARDPRSGWDRWGNQSPD